MSAVMGVAAMSAPSSAIASSSSSSSSLSSSSSSSSSSSCTRPELKVELFSQPVDANFVCIICTHVFNQPLMDPHGHTFCERCIGKWLEGGVRAHNHHGGVGVVNGEYSRACPINRGIITQSQLARNLVLSGIIDNLQIRCMHSVETNNSSVSDGMGSITVKEESKAGFAGTSSSPSPSGGNDKDSHLDTESNPPNKRQRTTKGRKSLDSSSSSPTLSAVCDWMGPVSQYANHLAICGFELVLCDWNGCSLSVPRRELASHNASCPHRQVHCSFCSISVPLNALDPHISSVCPLFMVPCPQSCTTSNATSSSSSSIAGDEGDEKSIDIAGGRSSSSSCSDLSGKSDASKRITNSSSSGNGHITLIARQDVNNHIKQQCVNTVVECDYKSTGCTFSSKRAELCEHLASSTASIHHTNLLLRIVQRMNTELESTTERFTRSEQLIVQLQRQNQSLQSTNHELTNWRNKQPLRGQFTCLLNDSRARVLGLDGVEGADEEKKKRHISLSEWHVCCGLYWRVRWESFGSSHPTTPNRRSLYLHLNHNKQDYKVSYQFILSPATPSGTAAAPLPPVLLLKTGWQHDTFTCSEGRQSLWGYPDILMYCSPACDPATFITQYAPEPNRQVRVTVCIELNV